MNRSSGSSWSRRKTSSREPDDGGFETMRPNRDGDDEGFETLASSDSDDSSVDASSSRSRGLSLKARAVGYLSRREYARSELARKLQPYAEDTDDIPTLLDELEKGGWLSTERFAQSLVNRRSGRQGTARIIQELRQHGVSDDHVAELRDSLHATEYQRALSVWEKRFSAKPTDHKEYAKQARFLVSRGFAHEAVRRILGKSDDDS